MFFDVHKITKDIELIYQSLTKKGGIPEKWWFWKESRDRIQELSEEDENLIEDIQALYQHAQSIGHDKLLDDIRINALKLRKYLLIIKEEIDSEEIPKAELQELQIELLDRIVEKLRKLSRKEENQRIQEKKRISQELSAVIESNTEHHQFIFYRSEHLSTEPQLNESVGQFGRGVYFAVSKETAKRFRSHQATIFKFIISPGDLLQELNPIFISREKLTHFEERDPRYFEEYILNKGYGEISKCIIGPIPDMGYAIQLLIEKEELDRLIDEKILKWEIAENFN